MFRALLPLIVSALAAAPALAQEAAPVTQRPAQDRAAPVQGPPVARPAARVAPAAGQRGAAVQRPAAEGPLDAAHVAAMRARLERAKASGKFTPERLARQEERLVRLEQQVAAQQAAAGAGTRKAR
jgi:hypothetical protein